MNSTPLETKNLILVAQTRDEVRAGIDRLEPDVRKELSSAWLALLDASSAIDPWIHGFVIRQRSSGDTVGQCGFKGPPDAEGVVEIAYGLSPEHQGRGYATEAAAALTNYAFESGQVRVVRAHTLPEANSSGRVLTKCGFERVGDVTDPDDGLVWCWEKRAATE